MLNQNDDDIVANLEATYNEDHLGSPLERPDLWVANALAPFLCLDTKWDVGDFAELVFRAVTRHGGNPNRAYTGEKARSKRFGIDPRLPSPSALSASFKKPESGPSIGVDWGYNPVVQQERQNSALTAQTNVFQRLTEATRAGQYGVFDGTPMAYYGRKPQDTSKDSAALSEYQQTAIASSPIIRSRKNSDKGLPHFAGTTGGPQPLVVSIHGVENQSSQVVHVDFFDKKSKKVKAHVDQDFWNTTAAVERGLESLGKLHTIPSTILVDKEYTGDGGIWEALRRFADPKDITVVGPAVRNEAVTEDARNKYLDRHTNSVIVNGELHEYAIGKREWGKASKGPTGKDQAPSLVHFYSIVPYDFKIQGTMNAIAFEGNITKNQPRVAVFTLQTNLALEDELRNPVPPRIVHKLLTIYSRRWAIESLFGRLKTRFSHAFGKKMFARQMYFAAQCLAINSYGLWRQLRKPRSSSDPEASMTWWIGDTEACFELQKRAKKSPAE